MVVSRAVRPVCSMPRSAHIECLASTALADMYRVFVELPLHSFAWVCRRHLLCLAAGRCFLTAFFALVRPSDPYELCRTHALAVSRPLIGSVNLIALRARQMSVLQGTHY